MTASAELTRRQRALSETLNRALHALRRNVVGTQVVAGSRQLDHVRQLKQSVRELLVQSQALEEALRGVLDEDEDMEAMYLTRRHLAVLEPLVEREHEEVELLLESYLQEVGATVSELDVLTYAIEGTEKFVSFRLDSARNRLLKVDVIATASATALGVGQLVSGIFGMNLPTSLFDPDIAGDDATFVATASVTVAIVCVLILLLLLFFYWPPLSGFCAYCCGSRDDDLFEELGLAAPRPELRRTTMGQVGGAEQVAANGGAPPNGVALTNGGSNNSSSHGCNGGLASSYPQWSVANGKPNGTSRTHSRNTSHGLEDVQLGGFSSQASRDPTPTSAPTAAFAAPGRSVGIGEALMMPIPLRARPPSRNQADPAVS